MNPQPASQLPKYARISQSLVNLLPDRYTTADMPTLPELLTYAEDIGMLDRNHVFLSDEKLGTAWGKGVWEVGEGGALKLVASQWDTSRD